MNYIAIDNKITPSVVCITIKQSKTDPFKQGIDLFLGIITDQAVCPVKSILPYLALRGNGEGPLFMTNRTPLTRLHFSKALSAILKQIGLDDQKYNTHSFCIGAATSAKAAGVSDSHIKMLGRWQSSAYQLYIRTIREQLAALSRQLIPV